MLPPQWDDWFTDAIDGGIRPEMVEWDDWYTDATDGGIRHEMVAALERINRAVSPYTCTDYVDRGDILDDTDCYEEPDEPVGSTKGGYSFWDAPVEMMDLLAG
jgi:hypothetical protein